MKLGARTFFGSLESSEAFEHSVSFIVRLRSGGR